MPPQLREVGGHKNQFFCHSKCILGDVLDNSVQKFEKIFLQKQCILALECLYGVVGKYVVRYRNFLMRC